MKKTLVASSLAIGLGVVAGNASHDAHASETTNVDKAELAQKALTNDQSLNESPVQEGAYNINFDYNGNSYHFESDGSTWSWSYESTNNATQPVQPSQSQVATQQQPVQVSAPQNEQTAQPQTKSTSTSQTSSSKASSGSSVNVNSHLQQIAQRESGGDIHAINPSSGAAGKYQFLQSTWDSVAPSQYKGVSPAKAPESVQDRAAVKLYNTGGPGHWVTA